MAYDEEFKGALEWRCIGPFRGGRVVAVAGAYDDPNTFYFGAVAGGVWKTHDAGTYWECVSDDFFTTSSVGALAVAPSDSNVIYAGMGETTIRIDVSHGDGVYKSTDAGRTWTHVGLADTRHIGKIRVHPQNPDIVYVAALGHAFGSNDERGVFKSTDGGASWRKVLYVSDKAGAVDLSLDPANPRMLYAAVWEAYRSFWRISSGGPDSGIWQSSDGGETWTDISDRPGLPKGTLGKIAVAASPAQSGRVWALIEHKTEGGLYRSDDAGATWEKVSADQNLVSRAWYYVHLTPDPQDADTIYVNNLSFWKSNDGGRTFHQIDTPHGDNHDLWIDPRNNKRMIQGNDGGACVSLNGAATWSTIYNQPTAQFYHLATDTREPYRVYGTQQDNTSIAVPSRTKRAGGIHWTDCYVAGTGESGYIVVHPDNPDILYVGAIGSSPGGGNCIQRYDHSTGQLRLITTWPEYMGGYGAEAEKYRFAWTYPIVMSPHDANTIYIGGNIVFKTTDEGQSWQPISPDLTRADPETLKPTGGPVNRDSIGAETYATVFALAESPHEQGVLWAGSDDGMLHISRDGGQNWSNITPPDLPEWTMISGIEPSPHDPATAYVAGTRYKIDDYQPYLYKTTDYGQSWQRINDGIPAHDFTRVIRADPARPGMLYAGTETSLYLSLDDGVSWQRFQMNLPVAPIHEILIKDNDLIVGTHGRSIWILDDLTQVRQLAEDAANGARLLKPATAVRPLAQIDWTGNVPNKNYFGGMGGAFLSTKTPEGEPTTKLLDMGKNPFGGAVIVYKLAEEPQQPITLTFKTADENLVRSFSSKRQDKPAEDTLEGGEASVAATPPTEGAGEIAPASSTEEDKTPKVPTKAGWNRFEWNLRYAPAPKIEGNDPPAETEVEGPMVLPGTYQVTLTIGDQSFDQSFEVVKDAGITTSDADIQAQFTLRTQMQDKISETVNAINRMRDLRQQLDGWNKRAKSAPNGKPVAEAAAALKDKVLAVEKTLLIPDLRPGWADNLNQGVRLLEQITGLTSVVELGEYRPTDATQAVFAHLSGKIDEQLARFQQLIDDDLAQLNSTIAGAQFGAILLRTTADTTF